MLFMVIEQFKNGDFRSVGRRFQRSGRMLPDGVTYIDSWMDSSGARCFQLMEAPHADSLDPWVSRWADLVVFEIIPVESSREFWLKIQQKES